jgi:hypothetical protein
MNEIEKHIKRILFKRQAYRRLFMDEGKLKPDAEVVLADLLKFCRFHQSITVVSPISRQTDVPASFQAEGRREVITHIIDHINADDSDLYKAERNSHE